MINLSPQRKLIAAVYSALFVVLIAYALREQLSGPLKVQLEQAKSIPTPPSITAGHYIEAPINPRS